MEIENVHVSGFKAIDEIEFEPGQITLVTGPNNSGKTSLLEAIRLGVDPTSLREFGDETNKIINTNSSSVAVSVGRTDEAEQNAVTAKLRRLSGEKATQALINSIAYNVPRSPPIYHRIQESEYNEARATSDLSEIIRSVLATEMEITSEVASNQVLLFTIRGNEIPYVFGKQGRPILPLRVGSDISKKIYESGRFDKLRLSLSPDNSPDGLNFGEISGQIGELKRDRIGETGYFREIRDALQYPVNRFGGESPDDRGSCKFVRRPSEVSPSDPPEQDDGMRRMSEIRDLLNAIDVSDSIDTLSFDQVVFEGEDGRYQVPYEFTGDGFQAIVKLLWVLFDTDELPDVLLLEEPDTHMHPEYVRQLVRQLTEFVRREGIQLFVTTHDIDMIRSFFDAVDPEQQEFLEENFRLLQMDPELPQMYDYEDAREVAMEMQIDLRGR